LIDYQLALILSVFIPIAFFLYRRFDKPLAGLAKDVHKNYADLSSRLQEDVDNARDLQANIALSYAYNKQETATVQYNNSTISWGFCNQKLTSILSAIPSLILTAIWIYAGFHIIDGNMSLGTIISFMYVLALLYSPLDFLFGFYAKVQSDFAILDRLQAVLSTSTERTGTKIINEIGKQLSLDQVAVSYGTKEIISNLSLTIQKGDFIIVNGPSGSGKTTLLNTIAGFYDDYAGVIRVDSEPLQNICYQNYQKLLGIVPQRVSIYQDTLKQNLTMGLPATQDSLQEVLEACSLEDFINSLANGLDSPIAENGSNLSGGQRQKIAIARVLLRKPSILLLDEPFNHLDVHSKDTLMSALIDYNRAGNTILVASHNEYWPKFAHRLITMQVGRVVDCA
jgi:ABC-type bacteriocin/lantibiotic exporter with double-glycine peptidase domain